jgi:putative Mg2+ transporter-C (MgtC) family protein
MLVRFLIALALGALIGLERELVGKEAGIRTTMIMSAGAAVFSMIALTLPYIVALSPQNLPDVIARNSGFLGVIANIVVGVGFLGAGIILKTGERVHGLTTAAVVWTAAAIGTLAGIGLIKFAVASSVIIAGLLYLLRKLGIFEHVRPDGNM